MQNMYFFSRLLLKKCTLPASVPLSPLSQLQKLPLCFRRHSSLKLSTHGSTQNLISPYIKPFNLAYNDVLENLTVKNKIIPPLVEERLKRILNYNTLGGKKIRGLTATLAYSKLSLSQNEQDIKLSHILGWCVELIQAFFIITDDIIDGGEMRRGQPCWFRREDVGLQGVNDALLVETCVYHLLKIYFSKLECYTKLVDEVTEAIRITAYGQCLDMAANPSHKPPDLDKFSLNTYKNIAEFKTAYYTYCLPVYVVMHFIGGFDADHFEAVKNICLKLGYLFQMQDDYLDIYGQTSKTGKVGKDIQEGKCTWFSAMALENADSKGKQLMKEYYGLNDDLAVQKVLEYYNSLSMKERYHKEEEILASIITKSINQLDSSILNKELFNILLMNIFKREM